MFAKTYRHNQHAKRRWHKLHPLMRKNAVLDAKLARMLYNKGNEPPRGSFTCIPMHTAPARTQELLVDVMQLRRARRKEENAVIRALRKLGAVDAPCTELDLNDVWVPEIEEAA